MTPTATDIVAFLSKPGVLGDGNAPVTVQQTRRSWIFLTAEEAYKLRKPIRTDTLNFTTLDLREQACRRELIANRRFSPEIYLSVMPIRQSDQGELSMVYPGRTVDWLLKMRRLETAVSLETLMANHPMSCEVLDPFAKFITNLLVTQPPLVVKVGDLVSQLSQRAQIKTTPDPELDSNAVDWVQSAIRRYIAVANSELAKRVCDGRVIDGHGNLDPTHLFLGSKPAVISSLTTKADRCCDIANELARLAMECDRRQHPEVGIHLKSFYEMTSNDLIPESLFSFYKSLQALQQTETNAKESNRLAKTYLRLAREYAAEFSPLVLVVVEGKIRSRRSQMADVIVDRLSATTIQSSAPSIESFNGNPTIVFELSSTATSDRDALAKLAKVQKLNIYSIDANRVLSDQLDAVCESIRQSSYAAASK